MDENLARNVLTYRWIVFWVMALGYLCVFFYRLCPAVICLDLQRAFEVSGGFIGFLASAYFYPYVLMQFPAGLLSDSLGPRETVTFFLTVAAIGSILFGLAPGADVAFLARVVVGLGVSMVFVPTMKILSQWFRAGEFTFMVAILNAVGGIGILTAATPLASMTAWIGWRASFQVIGLGTLIIAALVWLLVRNKPQDNGWPSITEIEHVGLGTHVPRQSIKLWQGARLVFTEKYFWAIAAWFFWGGGIFFGFGGLWAGPYLQHVYGLSLDETGKILSMISVGMILGSPLVSFLSNSVFRSRRKVLRFFSLLLMGELLFINIFHSGLPIWGLYVVFILFSISSFAMFVIGFSMTKELFPLEIAGTSLGAVNAFPFLGGALFQPVLGFVLDLYSGSVSHGYSIEAFRAMLLILLAMSAAAAASTMAMKETYPKP